MIITIKELLEGKGTIIKNKEYFATKSYVKPFIDYMSAFTDDFRVNVKLPNQITVGSIQDITYNRVLIEAVLPNQHDVQGHSEVIGFVYGLDVRKPIAKTYKGYLNKSNDNLIMFKDSPYVAQAVEPEEGLLYKMKMLMEKTTSFSNDVAALKKVTIDKATLLTRLGKWVDFTLCNGFYNGFHNVKLSPNVAVDAYKSLYLDKDSKYYVPDTEEPTLYDVYNAFAKLVIDDDKDIMNRFEKTMLINQLIEL